MSKQFKPLLAATIEDTVSIPYPILCSVKLDGIRCLIIDGIVMSRSLKPIRNKHVQALFGKNIYNGLDGELIVGPANAPDVYRVTNSGVMSEDGEPEVRFFVFDRWDMPDATFSERLQSLSGIVGSYTSFSVLGQTEVKTEAELIEYERHVLNNGYEGVMCRKADGKYKNGRSTLKEFALGKLKRFSDAEYRVVGFEERTRNENEAVRNNLGYIERSSHKENKIGRGDLGALVLETEDGQRFNCGTGFTDALRAEIWAHQDQYLGKFAKVKSFVIGVKDLPRFPVFLGWRDESDMS